MKNYLIGLQLYSVRDVLSKDFEGTIAKVAAMGYNDVEFAGDCYGDLTGAQVKALLDKYKLKSISVHQRIDPFLEDGQKAVDFYKAFGVKYIAVPYYQPEHFATAEERALTLKKFRQVYDLLKANGMEMQYHNHDFEFMKVEGDKLAIDWLYDEMPGLCPQLDTGWVKYAGADPVEYINKYAKRMHTIHIKDFTAKKLANGPVYDLIGIESCPTKEDNGFRYKPLGAGIQDFDAMFKAIDNTDIECLIVEQDENYDVPSLVNAEISRKYLQTKGL